METVYRGQTGSHKVESSKARGLVLLRTILYLLTGEPKMKIGAFLMEKKERFQGSDMYSEHILEEMAIFSGTRMNS